MQYLQAWARASVYAAVSQDAAQELYKDARFRRKATEKPSRQHHYQKA